MNSLQSLIYGIVSGLSQFLPVSSLTNQSILMKLFGIAQRDHLCDMIVHICLLCSLLAGSNGLLNQLRQNLHRGPSYHVRNAYSRAERRFSRNASYCLVLLLILFLWVLRIELNYLIVSVLLIVNGVLLFIPSRIYQGNKDARSMSLLDSILLGVCGSLFAIPGFSGIGCCVSVGLMRGADRQHALNWALVLCVPALIVLTGADVVLLISNWNAISFGSFFGYLLAGAAAYICGYLGIFAVRLLTKRVGFYGFAFYSWGLALLMLLLFLI